MRSGKDAEDMSLQFHCRQDFGGHTHCDRNSFTLSSLGRIWFRQIYGGSQFQPSRYHSSIHVDGKGMSMDDPDGDKCRKPGEILCYEANDTLTQVAGDATYAYNWEWHWTGTIPASQDHYWLGNGQGWSKVTETLNDFQYKPQTETHFHTQIYEYSSWYSPYNIEHMIKRPYNPIEKAIRTVGLFKKGCQPFVLVADEFKKDDNAHFYEWLGQIARDLTIESTDVNLDHDNYRNDIIFKEPESEGNRRMLVRILNNEGFTGTPGYQDTLDYVWYHDTTQTFNPNPNWVRPRLIVESNSVEPKFKIFIYPFMDGDALPHTSWNATKDTLKVATCDSTLVQEIHFQESPTGATKFEVTDIRYLTSPQPPCTPYAESLMVGNDLGTGGSDGWSSNMVIHEADTYTNTSGAQQTVYPHTFNFNAHQEGDPVTPFVVRVNSDNNFTVLSVGSSRTSADYNAGQNSFDFKTGGTSFVLNDGETIAVGFLDAYADGTGSGTASVISNQTTQDEIWYSGHSGNLSGSVTEGLPPVPGSGTITTLTRTYHFNIDFTVAVECPCPSHIDVPNTVLGGTHISGQTIHSDGTIDDGSNVIYNTGNCILLKAGFSVPRGAEFETVIEGCDDGSNQ